MNEQINTEHSWGGAPPKGSFQASAPAAPWPGTPQVTHAPSLTLPVALGRGWRLLGRGQ